ncbi:ATP-binding protein [Roseateles asaccharophilus]|uniref:Schlafen AlbA-2 domain-containing protein n=1 Tax=Roseateles asaccharophilus TaxID=582607 RepID=A0ABU2AGD1_9BURK|nr:ATP-binding protein [Roseateles asaccharophilus]MDR7336274.1 hypothetical protein [Roseateles asaccharophilus]
MIDTLIAGLRYKAEGTDLDFKSAQYRFSGASDDDKSEILKDILAIANAWRDGDGHILLGFKQRQGQPAETVGISTSIDDSRLQQLVRSKIRPHLTFSYEEHTYEGKPIGVFTIPKQRRAFYLEHDFGKLSSHVVYVRRGSSTGMATPQEIADMIGADTGRGEARVVLSVMDVDGQDLADTFQGRYLSFEELPDFDFPFELGSPSLMANRKFWHQLAEFHRVRAGSVEIQFALSNQSDFQLSSAKLEVTVEAVTGLPFEMIRSQGLPYRPRQDIDLLGQPFLNINSPATGRPSRDIEFERGGETSMACVHFGALLPGERARASGPLYIVLPGPGELVVKMRVLAAELSAPLCLERRIQAVGSVETLDIYALDKLDDQYLAAHAPR